MIKVCHMTSAHEEEDIRIFRKECVSLAEAGYDVYLVERVESYEKNGVHIVGVGEIPTSRRRRMTGENTPNCSQRSASSSSRTPCMWPPMSWLHQL